jgi:hypothetical protein
MRKKKIIKKGVVISYGRKWNLEKHKDDKFHDIPELSGGSVGLYVLYRDRKIVYIGKSDRNLRRRLGDHTRDRLKSKWNYFSWFITKKSYISDLEALLHHIFFSIRDVELNISKAKFVSAHKHKEYIGRQ